MSITEAFFTTLETHGIDAALDYVDPDAVFVASRREPHADIPLFGEFKGHAGVRDFVRALGSFSRMNMTIESRAQDGALEIMAGQLDHIVGKTGKPFKSLFGLVCTIRDGKILRYVIIEDTARLEAAFEMTEGASA